MSVPSAALPLPAALDDWRRSIGAENVHISGEKIQRFGRDTSSFTRPIAAVLTPRDRHAIPGVVRVAQRRGIPIYPVSTGDNWGYGTANPIVPGCVIVDLGHLTGIQIDETLGIVTVEPGVTQQMLHHFLTERGLPFMVPVTGAGPHCSLLGNALERGFGLTPYADHFGAVTSLEAVLPNGELYRSAVTDLGGRRADRAFKWGVGPYIDGLFSQGAFGVVTQASLALARRPECTLVIFFSVEEEKKVEGVVDRLREFLNACGGICGGINLMSRTRLSLMTKSLPASVDTPASLIGSGSVAAWTGAGAIYGSREVVMGAKATAKRILGGAANTIRFVDPERVRRVSGILQKLPLPVLSTLRRKLARLGPTLDILAGVPSEVALPLAYANSQARVPTNGLDPARDGCGLYWYSPLVPMDSIEVTRFLSFARAVTNRHGMTAPVTFTSMSNRCFDATLPLLFDAADKAASSAAARCYEDLFESGRQLGFVPYRMGAQHMGLAVRTDSAFWNMVGQLKSSIDPNNILSPGRYAPCPGDCDYAC